MKALFIPALMPVIEQLATQALISNKAPLRGKNKLGLGLLALSGFFVFLTLIFLTLAGYGWLLTTYDQPLAALITAGAILLASSITAIAGYLTLKKKKAPSPANDIDVIKIATMLGETLGEDINQPIKDNPKTAIALASLAGFIAGDRV